LCWLTVEQQFIPALAIASAVDKQLSQPAKKDELAIEKSISKRLIESIEAMQKVKRSLSESELMKIERFSVKKKGMKIAFNC